MEIVLWRLPAIKEEKLPKITRNLWWVLKELLWEVSLYWLKTNSCRNRKNSSKVQSIAHFSLAISVHSVSSRGEEKLGTEFTGKSMCVLLQGRATKRATLGSLFQGLILCKIKMLKYKTPIEGGSLGAVCQSVSCAPPDDNEGSLVLKASQNSVRFTHAGNCSWVFQFLLTWHGELLQCLCEWNAGAAATEEMSHSSISVAKDFSVLCNAFRNIFLLLLGSSPRTTFTHKNISKWTGTLQTFSSFKSAVQAWLLQEGFSGTLNFVLFSPLDLFAGGGAAAREVIVWGYECVFWASLFVMPRWKLVEVCFKKEKLASHRDCESWAGLQKIFLHRACMLSPEVTWAQQLFRPYQK